jgi:hypothetical protein
MVQQVAGMPTALQQQQQSRVILTGIWVKQLMLNQSRPCTYVYSQLKTELLPLLLCYNCSQLGQEPIGYQPPVERSIAATALNCCGNHGSLLPIAADPAAAGRSLRHAPLPQEQGLRSW